MRAAPTSGRAFDYGAAMAAPNSDNTDPIASTYQFRAFAQRDDAADAAGRSRRVIVAAAVLIAAVLAVGILVILLVG